MEYILIALQLIVALGILNVWMLRSGKATPFRGGDAKNLREEFAAYGLPFWFMCVVGVLKVGLALALIAAIWFHRMAQPAAIGLGLLAARRPGRRGPGHPPADPGVGGRDDRHHPG